jgi:predicted nucleotidyltransferase
MATNPHSDESFAAIAAAGTILQCQVGSGVHGTAIEGQDDRDEMGVCIEPPEYVIGLERFEQYIFRTQPEGERSGPGDLDLIVYSLRKWMRLALDGNPTVLLPLFVPPEEIVIQTDLGRELRARQEMIVSRVSGRRFLGYLRSQRDSMLGLRAGRHTNRPELEERYGFDTKFAMHMVRLGVQGVELLETGRISLPIPEPWLAWLRELRRGEHSKEEALEAAAGLEARLEQLCTSSPLPERPPRDQANAWLVGAYRRAWAG